MEVRGVESPDPARALRAMVFANDSEPGSTVGDPLELALHGGEDYQLLLAVAADEVDELRELARVFGSNVTVIGWFVEGEPGVTLSDSTGERPLAPRGHDHYRALGG